MTADLSVGAGIAAAEARVVDEARPIDLLVNNAGFGTVGRFYELPISREISEIGLNVVAVARLTHAALPGMVTRGRGGVINVASLAGYQPTPLNATYGATKAFVSSLSQAVHEELRGSGVNCMVLCPGFTRTEFQQRAGIDSSEVPDFLWQDAIDGGRSRADRVRQGSRRVRPRRSQPRDGRVQRRGAVGGHAQGRRSHRQARREVGDISSRSERTSSQDGSMR